MKWINHKLISFSITVILTENILSGLISSLGSVIPDFIEGKDFHSEKWKKRHRTYSHWLLLWLSICIFLFFLGKDFISTPVENVFSLLENQAKGLVIYVLFWLSFGCVLHVLEDALTGGVPVYSPKKKIYTFKIFRTGHFIEYLISSVLFTIALLKFIL